MQNTETSAPANQVSNDAVRLANRLHEDEVEPLRKQKSDLLEVMSALSEASERETDIKFYEDRIAELDSRISTAVFITSRPYLIRWLNDTGARLRHEAALKNGGEPRKEDKQLVRKDNRERDDFLWDMMQNEARRLDGQNYEGSREEVYERLKGLIGVDEGGAGNMEDEGQTE